jgi:hypothetical protein
VRNFVKKLIGHGYSTEHDSSIQTMIDMFFTSLVSPQIDYNLKQHLVLTFENLLLVYQTKEENVDTQKRFFETIFD